MSERPSPHSLKNHLVSLVRKLRTLALTGGDFYDVRETGWSDWGEKHPGLAIRTVQKGERIPYKRVESLDELADTFEKLGCQKVLKTQKNGKTCAVEWSVDYQPPFLGFVGEGKTIPIHTLVFDQSSDGSMNFSCKINSEDFKTNSGRRIPNTLKWSNNAEETFSPSMGTYYFSFPFAQEQHNRLANSDLSGFQFEGSKDKDRKVKVRIGGIKFTFVPITEPVSILGGKVQIETPIF